MTDNTGHNGGETEADRIEKETTNQLLSIIERIEVSEQEKRDAAANTKEIYAEAKGVGFDVKAIRFCVNLRARDPNEVSDEAAMQDLYLARIGMQRP